jgi:hypothetical protein
MSSRVLSELHYQRLSFEDTCSEKLNWKSLAVLNRSRNTASHTSDIDFIRILQYKMEGGHPNDNGEVPHRLVNVHYYSYRVVLPNETCKYILFILLVGRQLTACSVNLILASSTVLCCVLIWYNALDCIFVCCSTKLTIFYVMTALCTADQISSPAFIVARYHFASVPVYPFRCAANIGQVGISASSIQSMRQS